MREGRKLFFEQCIEGHVMAGEITRHGELFFADVATCSGEACGTMRFRCKSSQITSNFKPLGANAWNEEVTATKEAPRQTYH
jgi:hypothetical protein